jgi:type I restriction enzyme M protein
MRKSLGDKRKYLTTEQIEDLTRVYHSALDEADDDPRVKVLHNADLGYQRISVERPLRRRWTVTQQAVEQVRTSKAFLAADIRHDAVLAALADLLDASEDTEVAFGKRLLNVCTAHRQVGLPTSVKKAILAACSITDSQADIVTDRTGRPVPDPELRDNENVPLAEDIRDYLAREVLPHVPDAWIDADKTKIGYEVPFTRHFYTYAPPRPVGEIDVDLDSVEASIQQVLRAVTR